MGAVSLSVFKKKPIPAYAIAAVLCLGAVQSLILGFNSLSETRSGRMIADAITNSVPDGTPVFTFQTLSESAVFCLDSKVILVEYMGELEMGIKLEPHKYVRHYEGFVRQWQNLEQAALIVDVNKFDQQDLHDLRGKIVYRGPKRMVIIKS